MAACATYSIHPPGRLRLTGYAALQVAAFVPLVVLFVFWVVGGVLMVVWVGALFLARRDPGDPRGWPTRHRRMAADVLGTPLPAPYAPLAGLSGAAASCGRWPPTR